MCFQRIPLFFHLIKKFVIEGELPIVQHGLDDGDLEDAKGCTWKEMLAASAIIQEINGLVPSPKAEAGGPATQVMKDTTSEAAPDSSDTSQESA